MISAMPSVRFLGQTFNNYRRRTVDEVRELVFKGAGIALVAAVIVWVAIFLYVAFYYTYIPSVSHIRPVHLQFRSCENSEGICSYPSAHVRLTKKQQLLMIGQQYKMYLHLEMPESPANQKLGMFMVCIHLRDKDNLLLDNSCRSTMLHYRSYLLHTLTTLIFSPMMMFGNKEEKQNIVLELFTDYEEDQNHPVTDIYVEIQSRQVELYSATLYIHAHFTGIRYFMFHWPILSAAVGITSNLFFIVLVCVLSWWHLHRPNAQDREYLYSAAIDEVEPQLKKKKMESFIFRGEPDELSHGCDGAISKMCLEIGTVTDYPTCSSTMSVPTLAEMLDPLLKHIRGQQQAVSKIVQLMMPASWMTTVPEMVKVMMVHCWYSLVDDSLSQNCHALKAPDDESKCQLNGEDKNI